MGLRGGEGAVGESSSLAEGGTVLVSPQAAVLVAGTPNFNVGSSHGELTVQRVTPTDVRINNRLGFPVDVVLTVHGTCGDYFQALPAP